MKLTFEVLMKLGFHCEGKDITDKPAFRLKIKHNSRSFKNGYNYELQIVLGDYPESNPNSGIISLHQPELKDMHCQTWEKDNGQKESKKIDFIQWREGGQVGGIKYVTFKEQTIPIAWHVTTLERLNQIYTALTKNPPLKLKP